MTKEDWNSSDDAAAMLLALHQHDPQFFAGNIEQIQRFLIACCRKNNHLIPQKGLQEGIKGAEEWLRGEIDDDELHRLNWHAEADAFHLDYSKKPEEIEDIEGIIAGIPELSEMPFEEARHLLKRAAYFAEITMVFQGMRPKPRAWLSIISRNAEFLCADLLRAHVKPESTSSQITSRVRR